MEARPILGPDDLTQLNAAQVCGVPRRRADHADLAALWVHGPTADVLVCGCCDGHAFSFDRWPDPALDGTWMS